MMLAVIDRFEEDKAVLLVSDEFDDELKIKFPRKLLPKDLNLKEGDYISLDIKYDEEATKDAQKEAQELFALLHKNK